MYFYYALHLNFKVETLHSRICCNIHHMIAVKRQAPVVRANVIETQIN